VDGRPTGNRLRGSLPDRYREVGFSEAMLKLLIGEQTDPYSIEHIHVPRMSPLNRSQLHSEFAYSVRCIEQEREKIEVFCAFLDSFSFKAYSLEYKIVGAQIKVIDWDTPSDKQILGSLDVHLLH
jgi:hypothetical protein